MLLLAAALLTATGGCYTYARSPGERVPESGEVVRAYLSDAGGAELRSEIGVGVRELFGRLRAVSSDSATLGIRRGGQGRADALGAVRDSITIPLSAVESWETQRFSAVRSGLAGLGAGAALAVAFKLTVEQSGSLAQRDGFDDGGGGEGALVPSGDSRVGPSDSGEEESATLGPLWVAWSLPVP